MKSAAIISKPSKPELASILPDLLNWFRKHDYQIYLDTETAKYTSDGAEVVAAQEHRREASRLRFGARAATAPCFPPREP